jgi:hypothetical protein
MERRSVANTITIDVVADAARASRQLRGVGDDVESVGRSSGRARSAVAGFAGAAIGGLAVSGFKDAASSALAHQEEVSKLSLALKTNNNISGTTVEALKAQAAATESLTGAKLDEDDILKGQQKLLRAGIVGRANYDKAVLASANLAVGTNTTAEAASKSLAKALAAPEKASGALAKSGVILTAAQKEQIAAFQKAGDTASAQGVILDAVQQKYKGVGAAAGQTLAGKLGVVQDTFQDTARDLLTKFLPAGTKALELLLKFSPVVLPIVGALLALVVASKAVSAAQTVGSAAVSAYGAVLKIGGLATKAYAGAQAALNFVLAANPIGLVIVALVAIGVALVLAYKKSETFRAIVTGAFAAVKVAIGTVITIVKAYGGVYVKAFKIARGAVSSFVKFFGIAYSKITGFFGGLKDAASDIGGSIFRGIIGGIADAYNALPSIVKKGIEKLPGIGGIGKALNDVASVGKAPAATASNTTVNQTNNYVVKNVPNERDRRLAAQKSFLKGAGPSSAVTDRSLVFFDGC